MSKEFVPSELERQSLSPTSFLDLVKELEAKRLANVDHVERMLLSNNDSCTNENPEEAFDDEFPIDRWLRLQAEEEANTRGRLTAPIGEIRKRQPKANTKKTAGNIQMVDQLRAKQINFVDEQTYLQKILQENASIAQDEARERLDLVKMQCEEARERLKLVKIQCQIAELSDSETH